MNPLFEFLTEVLLQVMMETSTLVTWPSKLKIGAKSKKGELHEDTNIRKRLS